MSAAGCHCRTSVDFLHLCLSIPPRCTAPWPRRGRILQHLESPRKARCRTFQTDRPWGTGISSTGVNDGGRLSHALLLVCVRLSHARSQKQLPHAVCYTSGHLNAVPNRTYNTNSISSARPKIAHPGPPTSTHQPTNGLNSDWSIRLFNDSPDNIPATSLSKGSAVGPESTHRRAKLLIAALRLYDGSRSNPRSPCVRSRTRD